MGHDVLNRLFQPSSIAVVGASAKPGKIGYTVILNLIESRFEGKLYPINPNANEILGLKSYGSILDVPGPVDTAVITVPAKMVPQAAEDCGKKGVTGLVIISSGFSEVGEKDLENQVVEIARKHNMRVLGPNIVGVLSNSGKMNASFARKLPLPGKASLVSQSGALLIAMDEATYIRRVGFDKLFSIGNMSDLDFADTISWLDDDPKTSCLALYIEGFKNGRRFIDVGRRATKPIIALKSGVSAHGAAAAASHTGSLAGAAKVYGAAFHQANVIEAADLNNLFDLTLAFSLQPPMKGDNLLIVTNGGGVGVLATDAAERYGLPLKFAPPELQTALKQHMPDFGSAKNPVDITGMAGLDWYYESVRAAYSHDWVDGLAVLYCETAITNPEEIAQGIKKAVDASGVKGKPIAVSMVGGENCEKAMKWLVECGIPAYNGPDIAVHALAKLREYARIKGQAAEAPAKPDPARRHKALSIIEGARRDGRDALTEIEAKQVFQIYDLPIAATTLARSEDDAAKLANQTGYPIVMKIVSPDILHKSDAGGVKVGLRDEAGVREAYRTILENAKKYKADARIHGVAIQEMAPKGTEVILGSVNDPTFGPTLMFGLGGIFVEVLKDVTFRVAPVTAGEAARMIGEIKSAAILAGARGETPRDRRFLAEIIARYSQMILDLEDEVAESDANPVLVYEENKGAKLVDARIILKARS